MDFIWTKNAEDNSYCEFVSEFDYCGGDACLRIGSDFKFEAFINERPVSFGQFANREGVANLNSENVTDHLKIGKNRLRVVALHFGRDFFVCRTVAPFVCFEIKVGDEVICSSDTKTLVRAAPGYRGSVPISPQLGYGWNYDMKDKGGDFSTASLSGSTPIIVDRPIKNLTVSDPLPYRVCAQGVFKLDGGDSAAEIMHRAYLKTLSHRTLSSLAEYNNVGLFSRPITYTSYEGDGIFITVDLGKECAGFLDFDITLDEEAEGYIGWGEHLSALRVRTYVGGRYFASGYSFKAGNNTFCGYLHRLGLRYITLYVKAHKVTLNRLTVRECLYPFDQPKKDFGDRLLNKIYEVGRRTLVLSAHEHYEDCPWREQALYGMDGRNQMLYGYGAFNEYEYPRAMLRLQGKTRRDDKLLYIVSPCKTSNAIPSFSLYWIIAICENLERDRDEEFAKEMVPMATETLYTFINNSKDDGVHNFNKPGNWNFYEWTDGLDVEDGQIYRTSDSRDRSETILSALAYIAAGKLIDQHLKLGNTEEADRLRAFREKLYFAFEGYYIPEKQLYASHIDAESGERIGIHCHTQAILLYAGVVPKERTPYLIDVLKNPEGKAIDMTPATLQFKYDAIAEFDNDPEWCINDIVRIFGKMVLSGATSLWETELGDVDFDEAGSLCHGWSAVPCYVFDKYLKNNLQ